MKITVDECYELEGDYQNQFLGNEVFPRPKYKKVKAAERTVNKVHYNDVYILEPLHYYYVTFDQKIEDFHIDKESYIINIPDPFSANGLLMSLNIKQNRMYLFNASQNIIYLQKKTKIGEVVKNGWKFTSIKDFKWYSRNYF